MFFSFWGHFSILLQTLMCLCIHLCSFCVSCFMSLWYTCIYFVSPFILLWMVCVSFVSFTSLFKWTVFIPLLVVWESLSSPFCFTLGWFASLCTNSQFKQKPTGQRCQGARWNPVLTGAIQYPPSPFRPPKLTTCTRWVYYDIIGPIYQVGCRKNIFKNCSYISHTQ